MPTTSNFGWTTPADTDLVKDGAAAIRTLGNGIDTSFLDLKGGTSGQVLSKNSNTDLDYTWVTPNVGDITEVQAGTGISVASGTGPIPVVTNSMATEITAKGDLIVGTGSGTFDNLAAGTNGHILTADSSVSPTGLKWAAAGAPSQDFVLINSGGTALTGSGTTTINVSGKNQLFIRVTAASAVGAYCVLHIRFNSDSGANYGYIGFEDSAGSLAMTQGTADTELAMGQGGNNAANNIAANIFVSGADATGYKPISYASVGSGTGSVERIADAWYSGSSAITSVNIISSGQNFDAGTVFVYGA